MSTWVSLVEADGAFSALSNSEGLRKGFLSFLSDDGLVYRPDPVNGREWYDAHPSLDGHLAWAPTYVDVSTSGELGYTVGPWMFRKQFTDEVSATGYYVSIWKLESDSNWKVVADTGIQRKLHSPPGKRSSLEKGELIDLPVSLLSIPQTPDDTLFNLENTFTEDAILSGLPRAYQLWARKDIRIFRTNRSPRAGPSGLRIAASVDNEVDSNMVATARVSSAGDLGYRCGRMRLKSGERQELNYLPIWKKLPGSNWKLALDITN